MDLRLLALRRKQESQSLLRSGSSGGHHQLEGFLERYLVRLSMKDKPSLNLDPSLLQNIRNRCFRCKRYLGVCGFHRNRLLGFVQEEWFVVQRFGCNLDSFRSWPHLEVCYQDRRWFRKRSCLLLQAWA